MASNPKKLQVTELDFDDIKNNFKTFLSGQSEFVDYDFEGSGMNILLDVLAYNTHYLAYNVNMAMNEAFLDSSVLRSSVVSHAKTLGYTPRSSRAPLAYVNVQLINNTLLQATLPKGTVFTASVDDVSYSFITNSDYSISRDAGLLKFTSIPIYEGTLITTKYTVDNSNSEQRFILTSDRADTNTLKVSVQTSSTDTTTNYFTLANDISTVSDESLIYFLQEVEDGKFEVYFGDGVIGKNLSNGNIVNLEYIVTNKLEANSASNFTIQGSVNGVSNIVVETVSPAFGGAEPETIDSIKYFAPLYYSSQNRAVTVKDYKSLIPKIYPNAKSVQVWGGEENDPPIYGQVFISIKPFIGSNLTESQKESVVSLIDEYNVASVRTTLVNPETITIDMNVNFRYNDKSTTKSVSDLETLVRSTIQNYSIENLQRFDKMFRYSEISALIDNSDASILSNITNINFSKKITPQLNTFKQYTVKFYNSIYHPHVSEPPVIKTTAFKISGSGENHYLDDDGAGKVRLYRIVATNRVYVNTNIGTIDYSKGEIVINSLNIISTANSDGTITLTSIPSSNDIVPLRNQILEIDVSTLRVVGTVDLDGTTSSPSSHSIIGTFGSVSNTAVSTSTTSTTTSTSTTSSSSDGYLL